MYGKDPVFFLSPSNVSSCGILSVCTVILHSLTRCFLLSVLGHRDGCRSHGSEKIAQERVCCGTGLGGTIDETLGGTPELKGPRGLSQKVQAVQVMVRSGEATKWMSKWTPKVSPGLDDPETISDLGRGLFFIS